MYVPGALGGQTGCWDPTEVVLHTDVNLHVDPGN